MAIRDLKRLLFRCAATLNYSGKAGACLTVSNCSLTVVQFEYDLLHYLVALPFEAFTPSAIAAGIEAWSWVIAEKPDYEVALMSEIGSAWLLTIKHERGMFSKTLECVPTCPASDHVHANTYHPQVLPIRSFIRWSTTQLTRPSSIAALRVLAGYSHHTPSFSSSCSAECKLLGTASRA